MDHPNLPSPLTVVSLLRQICDARPDGIAIEFGSATLRYRDLDALSDRLAAYLRDRFNISAGDLIGICLEPSPTAIVAMLAALKAGAAYVPLDAELPKSRLAYMFRDTSLKVVLTQRKFSIDIALGAVGMPVEIMLIDQDQAWQKHRSQWDPKTYEPSPGDLAYIIYTSGSTGVPKGVMVEHRGLINLTNATVSILRISPKSRLIQFSSFSFDAAVWEIFTALGGGGTLIMGTREDVLPGRALASFLARNRVTILCIPPSLLPSIQTAKNDLSCLDTVVACAELCPVAIARAWFSPTRRFLNAYGPTEITVCATIYEFTGEGDSVPIGKALPGVTTYVVDEDLNRLPPGQTGELCVGGEGVARGYMGKPERTAMSYIHSPWSSERLYRTGDLVVEHPETGQLEFLGRRDNQVKIRGLRVEIGAIEHALCQHPGVQLAAVAVFDLPTLNAETSKTLVGYFVPQPGADPQQLTSEALSRFLSGLLPNYMIPPIYIQLEAMPMKANLSKVDRAALPPPTAKRDATKAATTRAQQIAAMFDQALNLPLGTFQSHGHFFEMGGNSTDVAHLIMAIKMEYGVRLPPRSVYQYPTPTTMAANIDEILSSPYYVTAIEGVDLPREARLADVVPAHAVERGPDSPQVAFITGASGFIGTALLDELLVRSPDLKVYCLIRGESESAARGRLHDAFRNNQLHSELLDRVVVMAGDIEHEHFGLTAEQYEQLTAEVDTIYHCAADIRYVKPYSVMKKPNVEGTRRILELAYAGRPKTLQYASTAGVFGSTAALLGIDYVDEGYDIDLSANIVGLENGYTKSKWVAERIVRLASERGLRSAIHRLGFISGSARTGIGNNADLLCRLICGCIQMGIYPNFPHKYWYITPVDYAAKAMAHISLTGGTGPYHIVVTKDHDIGHNHLFETVNALGYPLKPCSGDEWFEALASCPPDNHLYAMSSFLLEKIHEGRNTIIEVHHTSQTIDSGRVNEALRGSGIEMPKVDQAIIAKYLAYFAASGLIGPPVGGQT